MAGESAEQGRQSFGLVTRTGKHDAIARLPADAKRLSLSDLLACRGVSFRFWFAFLISPLFRCCLKWRGLIRFTYQLPAVPPQHSWPPL